MDQTPWRSLRSNRTFLVLTALSAVVVVFWSSPVAGVVAFAFLLPMIYLVAQRSGFGLACLTATLASVAMQMSAHEQIFRLNLVDLIAIIAMGLIGLSVAWVASVQRASRTSREEAEQRRLRRVEENVRTYLEQVRDYAILIINSQGYIINWNEGIQTVLGYPPDESVGLHTSAIFPPEDNPRLAAQQELQNAALTGRAHDDRWQIRKNGERFWASGVTNAVRDEEGNVVGYVKLLRDDTQRKEAQEYLATQYSVSRVMADARSMEEAMPPILEGICQSMQWQWGALWMPAGQPPLLRLGQSFVASPDLEQFLAASESTRFSEQMSLPGTVWANQKVTWIANVQKDPTFTRREAAAQAGLRSAVGFPVMVGGQVVGVIEFIGRLERAPSDRLIALMQSISGQIGQFVQRTRFEQEVRRVESIKLAVVDSALDAVITIDSQGRILEFNPAAQSTFGYSREEALGAEMASLIIPPHLRDKHRAGLRRYLETGQTRILNQHVTMQAIDRNNRIFPIELSVTRISDEPPVFTAYLRDVTERVRAEQALRDSEARFRSMADSAPVMIWVSDTQKRVTWYNKRWLEFTGHSLEEELAAHRADRLHPDDLDRVNDEYNRAFDLRKPFRIEYRLLRHDGLYRWILGTGTPLLSPDGTFNGYIGSALDIHDKKLEEQEQTHLLSSERAARTEAERINLMKDEFLAVLSHELRTPLNAVLGWAELLGNYLDDPRELKRGLETITRNARTQAQMIEDLLDMSRIISGKVVLNLQPLSLHQVAEAAIESIRPTIGAKQLQLHVEFDREADIVLGDPARLQQVIWNLLSNAAKFTPAGGRVDVETRRLESTLQLSVADTGQGIKPEFLPHLFERFSQQDASTTRRQGGLGLGLSIVKQMVELHGGTIRAQSPGEGQGATFTLTLPLAPPGNGADREARLQRWISTAASERQVRSLWGLKVLVVDDEADALELSRRILAGQGADVRVAKSAAQALEVLDEFHPDVVVSDIGMPEVDGYQLLRQIRSLSPDRGGATPAVALTAFARPDDRARAIAAGFQKYVAKPIMPAELIASVASASQGQ